jgi:hypothetical protein
MESTEITKTKDYSHLEQKIIINDRYHIDFKVLNDEIDLQNDTYKILLHDNIKKLDIELPAHKTCFFKDESIAICNKVINNKKNTNNSMELVCCLGLILEIYEETYKTLAINDIPWANSNDKEKLDQLFPLTQTYRYDLKNYRIHKKYGRVITNTDECNTYHIRSMTSRLSHEQKIALNEFCQIMLNNK